MNTVYLVHVDTSASLYDIELHCMGIFDSREAAEERACSFEGATIDEIELNSATTEVYLGGY